MRWLIAGVLAISSCNTPYYEVYFAPQPLEARINDGSDAARVARALVHVRGIKKPAEAEPARVEARMRVENLGSEPVVIEPESFELVAANLERFDAPLFQPAPPNELPAGETTEFDVHFPLPPNKTLDTYDLTGLNLRWSVRWRERRVVTGASFQRIYYSPGYYYGYGDAWCWGASTPCHVSAGIGVFSED